MRERLTGFAAILVATTAIVSVANAQASYPCVNDAPNPIRNFTPHRLVCHQSGLDHPDRQKTTGLSGKDLQNMIV